MLVTSRSFFVVIFAAMLISHSDLGNAQTAPVPQVSTVTQNGKVVASVTETGLAPGAQLYVFVVDGPNGDFNGSFTPATATAPATGTGLYGAVGMAATNITSAPLSATGTSQNPPPIVSNINSTDAEMPVLNAQGVYVAPNPNGDGTITASTQTPISVVQMSTAKDITDAGANPNTSPDGYTTNGVSLTNGATVQSTTLLLPANMKIPGEALPFSAHELAIGVMGLSDCTGCASLANQNVSPTSPTAPTTSDTTVMKQQQQQQKSETPCQ